MDGVVNRTGLFGAAQDHNRLHYHQQVGIMVLANDSLRCTFEIENTGHHGHVRKADILDRVDE